MKLSDSIREIKGVGEKSEKLFAKLGIHTVEELLRFYPREFEIVEDIRPIACVREGQTVVIMGSLAGSPRAKRAGNLKILSGTVKDSSGQLAVTWFNMMFLQKTLHMGTKYILRGRVVRKNGVLNLQQPKILTEQEYHRQLHQLQPVYSLTAGLTNRSVAKAVSSALQETDLNGDFLPLEIRKQYDLMLQKKALCAVHFPKSREEYRQARKRLVFEEFFLFTLALNQMKRSKHRKQSGYVMKHFERADSLVGQLPYPLTRAQQRTWEELKEDMGSGLVMNRLIQGDVGCGKTIIAILALLGCVENGHQGAMMAPTEVLARQHMDSFSQILEPLGIRLQLLTGSMTQAQKREAYQKMKEGEADLVIGTHALIQEKAEFRDLALVVTDEQHRFGVKQRQALSGKGEEPHMLVMSATPIPRTLAIILYGDLDVSLIDMLPSNRLPVKNCVVGTEYRPQAYRFMQKQIEQGRQAYIICPMVEEGENLEVENVTDYAQSLRGILPPSVRIGILHGKMKAAEKDRIMEEYMKGELDLLVSTTVIEVGINVPNATVMMIENAERFGLAQLHQLRGRVGRGGEQSYCIFMAGNTSREVMERLSVIGGSNDGFFIAQQDLKMRGPGDLFGIRQSGELDFVLADIYQDADLLQAANEASQSFQREDVLELCNKYEGLHRKLSGYSGEIFL